MTELKKLAELIESAMYWGADTPEKIAERLIEDGVICPPCKVGDTVYVLEELVIFNYKCEECEYYDEGGFGDPPSCIKTVGGHRKPECMEISEQKAIKHDIVWWIYVEAFGKTIFLTREEAEAALAERREKNVK